MRGHIETVFCLVSLLGCINSFQPPSNHNESHISEEAINRISPFLASLGTVDGKVIFNDKSVSRNWADANSYCNSLGMRLLEITTVAQQNFLKSKYASNGFSGYYWISARDARTQAQFVWNRNGSPIGNVGQIWNFYSELTCVQYYASSNSLNGRWESTPCYISSTSYGALCETL